MTFTTIGTTDDCTTCDCCGKSHLKMTVVLRDDEGEVFFYGRTCAARATGWKAARIEREILAADHKRAELIAQAERYRGYLATDEGLARFMDANRVAFDRHHGGMTRANAIQWLQENLTRAETEAALPQRVA
jgi:hypothetical protein